MRRPVYAYILFAHMSQYAGCPKSDPNLGRHWGRPQSSEPCFAMHATLKSRLCVPLQPPNFVGDAADLGHRGSIDAVRLIDSRYVPFAEANAGKPTRR